MLRRRRNSLLAQEATRDHPRHRCTPQTPQNPTKRSWVHWMVADCSHGEVSNGKPVVHYAGPSPPQGEHRWVVQGA